MGSRDAKNNKIFKLVTTVIILAIVLSALILFYQKKSKPPIELEAKTPQGITHIKSIYGPAAGDNFDRPEAIAFDEDSNIYVSDTGKHRVTVFDEDGNFIRKFGNKETTPYPLGIAVSGQESDAKIYVASLMTSKIIILNNDGDVIKNVKFTKKEQTPIRLLVDDKDLYITAIGEIMVADLNGNVKKHWGKVGRQLGSFQYPNGIAIGRIGKLKKGVVISDSNNNRLQILNTDGKPTAYLGRPPKSLMDEELTFGLPTGLTLDDEGRVFVVDSLNHEIRVFDNKGNDLGKLGKQGSADGLYFYPTDIKFVDGKRFVIADKWNDRVQICELTVAETKK